MPNIAPRAEPSEPRQRSEPTVETAYATLLRGASFVGGRSSAGAWALHAPVFGAQANRYRCKTIANALRELDRFLSLLADAIATSLGCPLAEGQRNTANKLRDFGAFVLPWEDYRRLIALGRSRDYLFHCDGRVSRGDRRDGSTFTVGWPTCPGSADPLGEMSVGDRLSVGSIELRDIAAFYERLAYGLRRLVAPELTSRTPFRM